MVLAAILWLVLCAIAGAPGINEWRSRIGLVAGENGSLTVVEVEILSSLVSDYHYISIGDVPLDPPHYFAGARLLMLDQSVHSIYRQDTLWTESYWDEFSALPPIIPEGPIAILGLGAGTAARLLLHLWPDRELIGWEIDEMIIDKAKDYFELSEIEGENEHGGGLQIHIDDAFADSKDPEGGFAGILVDLFSQTGVSSELYEVETWFKLKNRLKPGGRIMINFVEYNHQIKDNQRLMNLMSKAFPGEVHWRAVHGANNKMAFTGPFPNITKWSQALPEKLKRSTLEWKKF